MDLINIKEAILVKRYKRFLAEVILKENNEKVIAHCPNSGSMLGLNEPNLEVYVSHNPNAKNLKYKLEIIKTPENTLVGINTLLSNKIVAEALSNKQIEELESFSSFKGEQKFNNSRFDFFLQSNNESGFLEVKNVTLKRTNQLAEFPDAKTERGKKHLEDLIKVKEANLQAFNLYLVQREDVSKFKIAEDIDKEYYKAFKLAKEKGVVFLCYSCTVKKDQIILNKKIDIINP